MFNYKLWPMPALLDVEFVPLHGVNLTSLQTSCLSSPVILLTLILSTIVLNCSFKLC